MYIELVTIGVFCCLLHKIDPYDRYSNIFLFNSIWYVLDICHNTHNNGLEPVEQCTKYSSFILHFAINFEILHKD